VANKEFVGRMTMKNLALPLLLALLAGCSAREVHDKNRSPGPNDLHSPHQAAAEPGDLIGRLGDTTTSNQERDEIVEELVKTKPLESAPGILALMRENCSPMEPGFGAKPWMEDRLSVRARIWYAAAHVWDALFEGPSTPDRVETLLTLLTVNEDSYSRSRVLKKLRNDQWESSAEAPVSAMAADPRNDSSIRGLAFETLLTRTGPKHAKDAMEYLETLPPDEQAGAFVSILNTANGFFTWPEDLRKEVIGVGFGILEHTAAKDKKRGYFLARRLGSLLQVPGEFAPDQDDPRYRGEHGLNDQFFSDTVENALTYNKQVSE
jgi:hypothetical protein